MNESCHTYEWLVSHIWMRHVIRADADMHGDGVLSDGCATSTLKIQSSHTYKWVISHIRMSHVTRMNESCHTYECVMSHIWMRHVTHADADMDGDGVLNIEDSAMSHVWLSHVTHMNKSCHTYYWGMSHMQTRILMEMEFSTSKNSRIWSRRWYQLFVNQSPRCTATHCNMLQRTATRCDTL